MKIFISGKGGSGKSTISALIVKDLNRRGVKVLAVDTDESNYGFYSQLGVEKPADFMNYFGGRKVLFDQVKNLPDKWKLNDIPEAYMSKKENIKLLSMGKITNFGEGCACPINVLSSKFIEIIDLKKDEYLIADTDAGIEHLGRGVDKGCDIILIILDPSQESIRLSDKISGMAKSINKDYYYILNRIDEETKKILLESVDNKKVIASIPDNRKIARANLKGEELDFELEEIEKLVNFLEEYKNNF
ncbi:MAG: adenylyl-sulfate kinase [Spirochaetes bacterium]|nr:adenylyl-sulfate kinase [Spirochaetota bacterium]